MALFIIEHLENKVYPWVQLEYRHISRIVGKAHLLITNVKRGREKLKGIAVLSESVAEIKIRNACVLDPEARKTLTPADAKKFDAFVFGGILGDCPPRKRTGKELTSRLNAAKRNLGKQQMSTDTAVHAVKKIVEGKTLKNLEFVDGITIPIRAGEEVELPYRYLVVLGKPILPRGLISLLRKLKGF